MRAHVADESAKGHCCLWGTCKASVAKSSQFSNKIALGELTLHSRILMKIVGCISVALQSCCLQKICSNKGPLC